MKRILARTRKAIAFAATASAASMTLTVALSPAAHATASSSECPSVVVIVVRGSAETAGTGAISSGHVYKSGGFGISVTAADDVQTGTSSTVRKEAVIYPATILPTLADPLGYLLSVTEGREALGEEVEYLNSVCASSTRIVMIGYSQGAQVIGDLLDKTTSQQLSAGAKKRIKAVAFFGDPEFNAAESFDSGTYSKTQNGLFPRAKGNLSAFASIIRSYCSKGDEFCQAAYPNGGTIHASYSSSTFQTAAANFILGKL